MTSKKARLIQGNRACAEGAMAAGVRFFAGYPITPSTEIAEIMSEELPKLGGKFIQMEDEIASMACIIGASLTGKKVLTASSGPGISLKQEAIGYACMTEIPCVIVNVQRLGPSTGGPTSSAQGDIMQARWGTHGDHPIIALCPSSVYECFTLTVTAVNFAEKYRTPVYVLMDEIIGHMREKVILPNIDEIKIVNRKRPTCPSNEYKPYQIDETLIPAMADFGTGYKWHVTGLFHDETGFPSGKPKVIEEQFKRLMTKFDKYSDEILSWEETEAEDAEILLVAYGSTARSALDAVNILRSEGIKVGLFRPITIWPFPEKRLKTLAEKANKIIVPEMNYGQLILEVERICKDKASVGGLFKFNSLPITPEEIMFKIREVL
ncbi:MAG: 2-oxoglutarate/2-oxoacid ferredoxin oxidoreductase subunit alpha [Clostridia bacterium]|jgi:2-oxoglutarate ferredoxin oxidoreductase subunit alpha|nr:2-oxoglutarate/2-oxoacid ferredoxin oxidoreductase subunit alpha [Clostridia bacterium]MDN5323388.1 2-oxoglutarate/2-oxoacid ferredoxin oxidoreductase subunit alpha [Clostridia bacterium]